MTPQLTEFTQSWISVDDMHFLIQYFLLLSHWSRELRNKLHLF